MIDVNYHLLVEFVVSDPPVRIIPSAPGSATGSKLTQWTEQRH